MLATALTAPRLANQGAWKLNELFNYINIFKARPSQSLQCKWWMIKDKVHYTLEENGF
mgnify:CR=1